MSPIPRIAISAGDPAGIGPDVVLAAAERNWPAELVVLADREMLEDRAALLGVKPRLREFSAGGVRTASSGTLSVIHVPLAEPVVPGVGAIANATGVLNALERSTKGCVNGDFDAVVTAPVNKAIICDSGVPFSGHTEYLAELTDTDQVVMLLATADFRVALATTHLPLRQVPDALSVDALVSTLQIMAKDLREKFSIESPRIGILGLNPHAGEDGHLGTEEQTVIQPAIDVAQKLGIDARGPWPADTAFNERLRSETDAYLAMYHDQGLPVLKYASFGAAVNITLGLPIIRTSVDHGTAFDLAGSGNADPGSFFAAIDAAIGLVEKVQVGRGSAE